MIYIKNTVPHIAQVSFKLYSFVNFEHLILLPALLKSQCYRHACIMPGFKRFIRDQIMIQNE